MTTAINETATARGTETIVGEVVSQIRQLPNVPVSVDSGHIFDPSDLSLAPEARTAILGKLELPPHATELVVKIVGDARSAFRLRDDINELKKDIDRTLQKHEDKIGARRRHNASAFSARIGEPGARVGHNELGIIGRLRSAFVGLAVEQLENEAELQSIAEEVASLHSTITETRELINTTVREKEVMLDSTTQASRDETNVARQIEGLYTQGKAAFVASREAHTENDNEQFDAQTEGAEELTLLKNLDISLGVTVRTWGQLNTAEQESWIEQARPNAKTILAALREKQAEQHRITAEFQGKYNLACEREATLREELDDLQAQLAERRQRSDDLQSIDIPAREARYKKLRQFAERFAEDIRLCTESISSLSDMPDVPRDTNLLNDIPLNELDPADPAFNRLNMDDLAPLARRKLLVAKGTMPSNPSKIVEAAVQALWWGRNLAGEYAELRNTSETQLLQMQGRVSGMRGRVVGDLVMRERETGEHGELLRALAIRVDGFDREKALVEARITEITSEVHRYGTMENEEEQRQQDFVAKIAQLRESIDQLRHNTDEIYREQERRFLEVNREMLAAAEHGDQSARDSIQEEWGGNGVGAPHFKGVRDDPEYKLKCEHMEALTVLKEQREQEHAAAGVRRVEIQRNVERLLIEQSELEERLGDEYVKRSAELHRRYLVHNGGIMAAQGTYEEALAKYKPVISSSEDNGNREKDDTVPLPIDELKPKHVAPPVPPQIPSRAAEKSDRGDGRVRRVIAGLRLAKGVFLPPVPELTNPQSRDSIER